MLSPRLSSPPSCFQPLLFAILGWLSFLAMPTTHAQTATDENIARARAFFSAGNASARAGDWTAAREQFERAYRLYPIPVILFNLANSQKKTNAWIEARTSFQQFLEISKPDDENREYVTLYLSEINSEMPRIRTLLTGKEPEDEIRLDNIKIEVTEGYFEINPGDHVLSALRRGVGIAEMRFTLSPKDEKDISLVIPEEAKPLPLRLVISAPKPEELVRHLATIRGESEPGTVVEFKLDGKNLFRLTAGSDGAFERALDPKLQGGRHLLYAMALYQGRTTELNLAFRFEPKGFDLFEEPWFWITLGTLVAGGIGFGIWYGLTQNLPQPYPTSLGRFDI